MEEAQLCFVVSLLNVAQGAESVQDTMKSEDYQDHQEYNGPK